MRKAGDFCTPSGIITSMPVYRLGPEIVFPPPEHADESGLLAVGGGLEPERLLEIGPVVALPLDEITVQIIAERARQIIS